MKYLLTLMLIAITACSSVDKKSDDEPPFVTGKKVKIHGCELWKEKEPEKADC